jgi:hypothetical protein
VTRTVVLPAARSLLAAWLLLPPTLAAPPRASAQAGCVPPAGGVPYLPGPPQWVDPAPPSGTTRPDVDDPRWVGSLRQDFPTQFGTEATFRALNAGGRLYFTFQSLTDPNGTTLGDTIWLGLGSGANSHLLMFDLDGAAGAGPTAMTFSYFTKAGGGAGGWTPGIPPAWALAVARWVGGGADPYAWVVNLQVETAGAGLGASFKLWYAITVNQSGLPLTTALYQWPVGGVSTTAPENVFDENAVDPDLWGDANSGSAGSPCTGGISLAWNQIGADPPPVNQISTVSDNQFFALPDYGSFAVVAGMIEARFRFADWGSTITDKQNAPWVDIALPAAGALNDAAGQIRFTCTNGAPTPATPACPAPSGGNPNHQCMLVELSKTPQAPGVVPNLFFSRDSAYRNMDFVAASRFESQAAIDLRGLPALASGPTRDVYLYVKTRNLPAPGRQPIELPRKAMEAARRLAETPPRPTGTLPPFGRRGVDLARPPASSASAAATAPAAPPPLPDTLAKSPYEHLAGAWPSYEVHAFHDTGRVLVLKGQKHVLVEPMVPFGYFVDHQGALYGFQHSLAGDGARLEELAANYYRVRVPHGSAVKVRTVIESADKPAPERDPVEPVRVKGGCRCGVLGAASDAQRAALAGLLAIALGAALVLRRKRRR